MAEGITEIFQSSRRLGGRQQYRYGKMNSQTLYDQSASDCVYAEFEEDGSIRTRTEVQLPSNA